MSDQTILADDSNASDRQWWKHCTVYQVWPASFKDSNGDGLGDIRGIISALDHIKSIGVDTIWLSPMYASPQVDMGYDISDYEAIYPKYGTMDDMDTLIDEMKKRDMKLLLDLVINHSSDQHKWFLESKSSRTNPKAGWYHWQDPKYVDGKRQPPSNWRSAFGKGAWTYVPERDQYYLHLFEPEQPDLNWENLDCRQAIHDSALRFWLKKGVAGFRMDTVNLYSKVEGYPDAPVTDPFTPDQDAGQFFMNGPKIHEYLQELRSKVLDPFGNVMTVGECPATSFDECMKYISAKRHELRMIFDFTLIFCGGTWGTPLHEVRAPKLPEMKDALLKPQEFAAGTDGWATIFGESHDIPRSVSRFGTDDPKYWERSAKVLAMLLTSLTGTLFIYQGQEIGMTNFPEETWTIDDLKDISSIKSWKDVLERYPDDKAMQDRSWKGLCMKARDNARTPVQWDATEHAGFSTVKPWMRVNENYKHINVAAQVNDENSVLSFWKRAVSLRKQYPDIFIYGGFELLDEKNANTFTFVKKDPKSKQEALVALNFSKEEQAVDCPERLAGKSRELLLSNVKSSEGEKLGPMEGRIYLFT